MKEATEFQAMIHKLTANWSEVEKIKVLAGCILTDRKIAVPYFKRLLSKSQFVNFLKIFDNRLLRALKSLINGNDPELIVRNIFKIDDFDINIDEIRDVLINSPEYYISILSNVFMQYISILNINISPVEVDRRKTNELLKLAMSYSQFSSERTERIASNIGEFLELLEKGGRVIYPTKFSVINSNFGGGLRSRRLYTIGGVAGVGKSHFLLNMFLDACYNKAKTVFITLENSLEETQLRIYANVFDEDIYSIIRRYRHDFCKGKTNVKINLKSKLIKKKIEEYMKKIEEATVDGKINEDLLDFEVQDSIIYLMKKHEKKLKYIYTYGVIKEMTTCTVEDLERIIREEEPDVLIVDYLNIIEHSPYQSRVENLEDLTMKLHRLAVEYDIAIVTACQQNREALRMKTPDGATVGESFGIVKASDVYFILYHPNKSKEDYDEDKPEMVLKVSKSRISPKFKVFMIVDKSRSQFREMTSTEYEEFRRQLEEAKKASKLAKYKKYHGYYDEED